MSVADFNIPKNHDGTIAVYTVQELQLDTFHVYKCWCECYTVIIQIIGVFNQLWDMKEYLMRVCIYIMIIIIKVLANAIVFFLHKIKILISLSKIIENVMFENWICLFNIQQVNQFRLKKCFFQGPGDFHWLFKFSVF